MNDEKYLVILDLNNCITTIIHLTKSDNTIIKTGIPDMIEQICTLHNVYYKESECSWAFSKEIIFE